MVPAVVLGPGTARPCWGRLSVDLVQVGNSDQSNSPSDGNKAVRSLDHGRLAADILPGSGQDRCLNYSSHYVPNVKILAVDD